MRVGVMIGPEKSRPREKVARMIADAEAAERAGFASIWVPQLPDDFDALTACALIGRATARIESHRRSEEFLASLSSLDKH